MAQNPVIPEKQTLFQRIRYSIFPFKLRPAKDRESYRRFFNTLILHFRPRTVPERTLRFTLTWGLGGMAVVLVFMLIGTGVLLKFVYEPFPDKAYESILHIQHHVLFGRLIRNIHHWSGNLLLIVVFFHFLRVFFTSAFHPPRQFNWVIGLGLFVIVTFSNFTGYLMPWDQLAFWAVTICASMLDYIPGVGRWLQIPHAPEENIETRQESVNTIPNLILREVVVALVLIAFILMFSIFFNAPLEGKANPGLSPNPTKAPWYFNGIQEMLMHFHPLFSLFIIPVLIIVALLGLPYIEYESNPSGVWFASLKGRKTASIAALVAIIVTPIGIVADEFIIDLAVWFHGMPVSISNGLIPFLIISAGGAGFYMLIKRKYSATNNEAIQAIFVLFLVAFLILTATGIWFRGTGMKLMLPF